MTLGERVCCTQGNSMRVPALLLRSPPPFSDLGPVSQCPIFCFAHLFRQVCPFQTSALSLWEVSGPNTPFPSLCPVTLALFAGFPRNFSYFPAYPRGRSGISPGISSPRHFPRCLSSFSHNLPNVLTFSWATQHTHQRHSHFPRYLALPCTNTPCKHPHLRSNPHPQPPRKS